MELPLGKRWSMSNGQLQALAKQCLALKHQAESMLAMILTLMDEEEDDDDEGDMPVLPKIRTFGRGATSPPEEQETSE